MRKYELMRPSFFENFDKDFDRFFMPQNSEASSWKPQSRVKEEQEHYHLAMDIPGVDKEDLKVELHDNVLSINGQRRDHFHKGNTDYESFASFEQKFSMPENVNYAEIEVSQENGILDIIIPKLQLEREKKSLEVKSGAGHFLSTLLK